MTDKAKRVKGCVACALSFQGPCKRHDPEWQRYEAEIKRERARHREVLDDDGNRVAETFVLDLASCRHI